MSGAKRYISICERTRALCTGLSLFGAFMDAPKSDPEFKGKEDAWHAWIKVWGTAMAAVVQGTHEDLWNKASRF